MYKTLCIMAGARGREAVHNRKGMSTLPGLLAAEIEGNVSMRPESRDIFGDVKGL